jgi:hypothetical protein
MRMKEEIEFYLAKKAKKINRFQNNLSRHYSMVNLEPDSMGITDCAYEVNVEKMYICSRCCKSIKFVEAHIIKDGDVFIMCLKCKRRYE